MFKILGFLGIFSSIFFLIIWGLDNTNYLLLVSFVSSVVSTIIFIKLDTMSDRIKVLEERTKNYTILKAREEKLEERYSALKTRVDELANKKDGQL
jgi:hypothetical protein